MKKLIPILFAVTAVTACSNGPTTSGEEDRTVPAVQSPAGDKPAPVVAEDNVSYAAGAVNSVSFAAWDKSVAGPRPVVLIIPEWWGLTDYPKARARELAKLGYFALAVDMYGSGKVAANPEEAGKMAGKFYSDTALVRSRLIAALDAARSMPEADGSRVVLMGYCFGGAMSLTGAKLGLPLRGAVSFHGNLKGTASNRVPVLVCHGADDQFVPAEEVTAWKKSMDSLRADYTFKSYPGATHAFTNPAATETGKKFNLPISYNGAADTASWADFQAFLKKVF